MLTFPHVVIAAAIVKLIPNPLISLPLALASHFFLDFVTPHWNPHLYTEYKKSGKISKNSLKVILIDGLLAFFLCLYIFLYYWPNIQEIALYAAAIFLATLPDTIEIPYYFFKCKSKWLKKYVNFEHKHQSNSSLVWGMTTQIITVILGLLIFFS